MNEINVNGISIRPAQNPPPALNEKRFWTAMYKRGGLKGTEKQIEWANDLRRKITNYVVFKAVAEVPTYPLRYKDFFGILYILFDDKKIKDFIEEKPDLKDARLRDVRRIISLLNRVMEAIETEDSARWWIDKYKTNPEYAKIR